MLAVTFVISCVTACGFYIYVLMQLQREHKWLNAHKKRLPEHFYEMEPEPARNKAGRPAAPGLTDSGIANSPGPDANTFQRRQELIQLSLAIGGLAALFAGVELFNSLVTRLHWN